MKQILPKVVVCEINENDGPGKDEPYQPQVHLHRIVNQRIESNGPWKSIRKHFNEYLPIIVSKFETTNNDILYNVYYERIKKINLEFIDISSEKAKSGKHWSNLYKHPYIFLFVVNCFNNDRYKNYVKKILTDLIRYCIRKDYQYIVVYTHHGVNKAKNIFKTSIFERIKQDFSKDRIVMLNVIQKSERDYLTLRHLMTTKILLEFVRRTKKFDEKIEQFKKGDTFKFFILQEGLAFVFEQFGLYIEAISKYKELKQKFEIKRVKFEKFHDGEFTISRIISPDEKRYRNLIFDGVVTEFDFITYLFSRQINLFFLMENLEEVSKVTIEFITEMYEKMRRNIKEGITEREKDIFIHSWCYCVARIVIEKSQIILTKFQNMDKIKSLFRSLSDLYVVARGNLQILGKMFNQNLNFKNYSKDEVEKNMSNQVQNRRENETEEEKKERIEKERKGGIIFTSQYHFSDRLKEALFNESEFKQLFIELLHTTRNAYNVGDRKRQYSRINKELVDIRMQQELYNEANLLLNYPKITKFYRDDGWLFLATRIDFRNAKCYHEIKKVKEFVESAVDAFYFWENLIDEERIWMCEEFLKILKTNNEEWKFVANDMLDRCKNFPKNSMILKFDELSFEKREIVVTGGKKKEVNMRLPQFFPPEIKFKKVVLQFKSVEGRILKYSSVDIEYDVDGTGVNVFKFLLSFNTIGLFVLNMIYFYVEDNFLVVFDTLSFLNKTDQRKDGNMEKKYSSTEIDKIKIIKNNERRALSLGGENKIEIGRTVESQFSKDPINIFFTPLLLNVLTSKANITLTVDSPQNGKYFFNKEDTYLEFTMNTKNDYIKNGLLFLKIQRLDEKSDTSDDQSIGIEFSKAKRIVDEKNDEYVQGCSISEQKDKMKITLLQVKEGSEIKFKIPLKVELENNFSSKNDFKISIQLSYRKVTEEVFQIKVPITFYVRSPFDHSFFLIEKEECKKNVRVSLTCLCDFLKIKGYKVLNSKNEIVEEKNLKNVSHSLSGKEEEELMIFKKNDHFICDIEFNVDDEKKLYQLEEKTQENDSKESLKINDTNTKEKKDIIEIEIYNRKNKKVENKNIKENSSKFGEWTFIFEYFINSEEEVQRHWYPVKIPVSLTFPKYRINFSVVGISENESLIYGCFYDLKIKITRLTDIKEKESVYYKLTGIGSNKKRNWLISGYTTKKIEFEKNEIIKEVIISAIPIMYGKISFPQLSFFSNNLKSIQEREEINVAPGDLSLKGYLTITESVKSSTKVKSLEKRVESPEKEQKRRPEYIIVSKRKQLIDDQITFGDRESTPSETSEFWEDIKF